MSLRWRESRRERGREKVRGTEIERERVKEKEIDSVKKKIHKNRKGAEMKGVENALNKWI